MFQSGEVSENRILDLQRRLYTEFLLFCEIEQDQMDDPEKREGKVIITADRNGSIGSDKNKAIGSTGRYGTYGTEHTINQNGKRLQEFCIT